MEVILFQGNENRSRSDGRANTDLRIGRSGGEDLPAFAIGFDLDMTLVDSSHGIAIALCSALGEQGADRSPADVLPWIGYPLERIIAELAPDVNLDDAVVAYRRLYPIIGIPETRLLPGAYDALLMVHDMGGRIVILSAKYDAGVQAVLAQVGIKELLTQRDYAVGGVFAEGKVGLLTSYDVVAYVGDHPGDIEAAKYAGAVSVAVATGSYAASTLAAAGADFVIGSLLEFPDLLRQLYSA